MYFEVCFFDKFGCCCLRIFCLNKILWFVFLIFISGFSLLLGGFLGVGIVYFCLFLLGDLMGGRVVVIMVFIFIENKIKLKFIILKNIFNFM